MILLVAEPITNLQASDFAKTFLEKPNCTLTILE